MVFLISKNKTDIKFETVKIEIFEDEAVEHAKSESITNGEEILGSMSFPESPDDPEAKKLLISLIRLGWKTQSTEDSIEAYFTELMQEALQRGITIGKSIKN